MKKLIFLKRYLNWSFAKIAAETGVTDAAVIKWVRNNKLPKERERQLEEIVEANRYTKVYDIGEPKETSEEMMRQIRDSGLPIKIFQKYFPLGPGMAEAFYANPSLATSWYKDYFRVSFKKIKQEHGTSKDLFDLFLQKQYNQNQAEKTSSVLPGITSAPVAPF